MNLKNLSMIKSYEIQCRTALRLFTIYVNFGIFIKSLDVPKTRSVVEFYCRFQEVLYGDISKLRKLYAKNCGDNFFIKKSSNNISFRKFASKAIYLVENIKLYIITNYGVKIML